MLGIFTNITDLFGYSDERKARALNVYMGTMRALNAAVNTHTAFTRWKIGRATPMAALSAEAKLRKLLDEYAIDGNTIQADIQRAAAEAVRAGKLEPGQVPEWAKANAVYVTGADGRPSLLAGLGALPLIVTLGVIGIIAMYLATQAVKLMEKWAEPERLRQLTELQYQLNQAMNIQGANPVAPADPSAPPVAVRPPVSLVAPGVTNPGASAPTLVSSVGMGMGVVVAGIAALMLLGKGNRR